MGNLTTYGLSSQTDYLQQSDSPAGAPRTLNVYIKHIHVTIPHADKHVITKQINAIYISLVTML